MKYLYFSISALFIFWSSPPSLHAALFTVTKTADTSDGACTAEDCSLREAIAAANANSNADTINFANPGIYTLESGELVITTNVEMNGLGQGENAELDTIIDGGGISRVFRITDVTTATLRDLRIRNGVTTGGIYNYRSTLTLERVTIASNSGGQTGGGIYNGGNLTLNDSIVIGNSASDPIYAATGGGIFNAAAGTVNLNRSLVTNNSATTGDGGGVYNLGTLTLISSRISNNSSTIDGGGVYNFGPLNVTGSLIDGNQAGGDGGGVFNRGSLTADNSTIGGNTANQFGGGLANRQSSATATLNAVTIAFNRADGDGNGLGMGGGIRKDFNQVTLNHSIVAHNRVGDDATSNFVDLHYPTAGSQPTLGGYTWIRIAFVGLVATGTNRAGTVDEPLDVRLNEALAANGGPTLTYALQGTSPLINAGHPQPGEVGACPITDQRGVIRCGACDIGAFDVCCGDGHVATGREQCDDGDTDSGDGCSSSCSLESGYACTEEIPNVCTPICGDGLLRGGETCDDGANNGQPNRCSSTCNGTTPSVCGNGVVEAGEGCDDGNTLTESCAYGQSSCTVCAATCTNQAGTTSSCGDGAINGPETCDDGNTEDDATCMADCSRDPQCGDGTVDPFADETCDDGSENGSPSRCNLSCNGVTSPTCGNGAREEGEACDTGGESDTCNRDCTTAGCGDGVVNAAAGETCDDRNTANGDGCDANCHVEQPAPAEAPPAETPQPGGGGCTLIRDLSLGLNNFT